MSINVIAESIVLEGFKELLFLHASSGSDDASSFFPVEKIKFWNSWSGNQDVPETFVCLGGCPSLPLREKDINLIERFIISLYHDNCNCFSIGLAWYRIFKHPQNMVIRSLLPTKDVLIQHMHKSAYVSGQIWDRANLPNKTDESPSN